MYTICPYGFYYAHCIQVGIAAEGEVNLLGNGTQTSVSEATNFNKSIPAETNRATEES
jgi:hypothetical protein